MKKLLFIAVLLGVVSVTVPAEAKRYTAVTNRGKQVVVHTKRAPVIVHKVFPPYGLGVHVYVYVKPR